MYKRQEIDRVASIVRRMSEIPQTTTSAGGIDISALVRELLSFYDATLFKARGIEVVVAPGEAADVVSCDRDLSLIHIFKQLRQVTDMIES